MAIMSRGVGVSDYINLSMFLKFWGGLIAVIGILVTMLTLWGITVIVAGVGTIVVGIGLGKYRPWAWWGAVIILIPYNIIGCAVATILTGFEMRISVGAGLTLISLFYVSWVLLSKGGRKRYRQLAVASKQIDQKPNSIAARFRRK